MPGFVVNGFGTGAPSTVVPYYKYTWDLVALFGDNITSYSSPLIYLKEASLPSYDFDKEEIQGASLIYKFAKSIKWNDIKLTWYDTKGLAAKMKTWRSSVWTAEGGLQPPDNYKRISIIRSLDFAWNNPVVWTCYNSWPSSVKVGDLTYTDSDVKFAEVVLTYDWATETTP